jgi:hypothetical protein
MLTQEPDPAVNAWELENTLLTIKRELRKAQVWQFREEYIDRNILDPYYIIMIRRPEADRLDDTGNQKVFQTKNQGLSYVNRTAQTGKYYWDDMDAKELMRRLDHFKKLYDANKLQPPGLKGDVVEPREQHRVFEKKRFIYEIISPFKKLTAIGPNMFAIGPGAVCGTVYNETGSPLDDATVVLVKEKETITRKTQNGGLFWFSKVSAGKYIVRVKDRKCIVRVLRNDEFGNISGWVSDQDGFPVEHADINFQAPDGKVFFSTSDATGKFTTGPLPSFPIMNSPLSKYPYVMNIPDFNFSVTKTVHIKDAIISGVLRNNTGSILSNKVILLKKNGVEVAQTKTGGHGTFRFFGLEGGAYELQVPEQKIFLSWLTPGRVTGNEPDGVVNQTRIELVADGKVITTERLDREKNFGFDGVAPGKYNVKTNI